MSRNSLNTFVLTPWFGIPTPDDVLRELRAMRCRAPMAAVREVNGLVCDIGNLHTLVVPLRGTVPAAEVSEGMKRSAARFFNFPPPTPPTVHAAQVAVTSSCKVGLVTFADLELHSMIVAAVAKILDASGVSSVEATHPAAYVIETAEKHRPLTGLWCGVSVAKGEPPGMLSYLSQGLTQLGLNELEVRCFEPEKDEALQWLLDGASYVAQLGRNLEARETFGRGSSDKRPVTLVPSPVDPGLFVCRLDLRNPLQDP